MSNPIQQIPIGYKHTEIGIIPEDWEIKYFKDLCWFQEGPGLRNWQFTKLGMKVINVTNLENGYLNLDSTDRYISLKEFNKMYKHFAIDEKDIVVASSGNSYAKVAVVRKHDLPLMMNTSVIRFKPLNGLNYLFLLEFLKSDKFKKQIDLLITGGAQPNFGPAHLKKIQIVIPKSQEEQSAVAQILAYIDSLIEKLEKLIAKKKAIKQGAMQELLTGKRRLTGFSGEWINTTFGEVLKVRHGKSQKEVVCENGKYPILATGGEIGRSNEYLYDKPSVLIGRKGTIDTPQYMDTPFWTVDTLFYTEINVTNDPRYIYYLFNTINWYNYNEASGVPSLNARTIENIEAMLPPTKHEQNAIANVLTDIDEEIEILEKKLEKYKQIKQGAMQVLLTGKVRLVKN